MCAFFCGDTCIHTMYEMNQTQTIHIRASCLLHHHILYIRSSYSHHQKEDVVKRLKKGCYQLPPRRYKTEPKGAFVYEGVGGVLGMDLWEVVVFILYEACIHLHITTHRATEGCGNGRARNKAIAEGPDSKG